MWPAQNCKSKLTMLATTHAYTVSETKFIDVHPSNIFIAVKMFSYSIIVPVYFVSWTIAVIDMEKSSDSCVRFELVPVYTLCLPQLGPQNTYAVRPCIKWAQRIHLLTQQIKYELNKKYSLYQFWFL